MHMSDKKPMQARCFGKSGVVHQQSGLGRGGTQISIHVKPGLELVLACKCTFRFAKLPFLKRVPTPQL